MIKEILEKVLNANKNLIVVGDVLSSETSNILLPIVGEKIKNKESLIIFDTEEKYLKKYSKELKDIGYNVLILNFRDFDKSEGWNPLEYPCFLYKYGNTYKAVEYLDKIAKLLFFEYFRNEPFLSLAASDFFKGLVLGLFEDGELDEINFNSIKSMLDGFNNFFISKSGISDYITEYFRIKDPTSKEYILTAAKNRLALDDKVDISIVILQKIGLYVLIEQLSHLLSKTTFKYSDCMNKPTAIFLIGRTCSKYMNAIPVMFIEQFFQILLDYKSTVKYNIVLDNIDKIDNINNFSDMMDSGISSNIKFYIGTYSIESLKAKYGVSINKSLIVISNKLNKLEIEQLNEKEEFENEFTDEKIPIVEIDYPKLSFNPIKVFNLENFVNNKRNMALEMVDDNNTLLVPSSFPSIFDEISDKYMEYVDNKIAEIEELNDIEKAKIEKNDSTDIKSEISEFKTEDIVPLSLDDLYDFIMHTVGSRESVSYDNLSIRIRLDNEIKRYTMVIKNDKNGSFLGFSNQDELNKIAIADSITLISKTEYDKFCNNLFKIVRYWSADDFEGDNDINWDINVTMGNDNSEVVFGEGAVPSNWNELVDLLSEYEILFKKKKKIDNESISNGVNKTFEEMVREENNDQFRADTIINYFKNELKENEESSKRIYKDLTKYNDIFDEFTKCLVQKSYDISEAISIEGYTAKQIHELNPDFTVVEVYTFFKHLRDNPEETKTVIKNGFSNKDVIPPIIVNTDSKIDEEIIENMKPEFKKYNKLAFYKNKADDKIWWVHSNLIGVHLFSFDKKKIYNFFRDYPHELSVEEKEIFDKENPYWANLK